MRGHLPAALTRLMGIMPTLPLELICARLAANALAARPAVAARLGEHADATFAIDPTDCPFAFLITPRDGVPSLTLVRELAGARYAARIAGPLVVLLGMLDGTYDGDALFFSRDLLIEGDTEAVLALRNALDDAELDPATVLGVPGPLQAPFNRGMDAALSQLRRLLDAPPSARPAPRTPAP
jgi:predicted lipid carrier protein YhbT